MHCVLAVYNKENAIIIGEEKDTFIQLIQQNIELLARNPDIPIFLAAALDKEEYLHVKNKFISGDNFIYTQTIT